MCLFWTSSGRQPATVPLDKHELRAGKTEVRVFLAFGWLFGHIKRPLGSMFEDVGHIWREIEHECKLQGRTFAILLEKCEGFASPTLATKSTRGRRGRPTVRFLHQSGRQKGDKTRHVTTTDVSFTKGEPMFPYFRGAWAKKCLQVAFDLT